MRGKGAKSLYKITILIVGIALSLYGCGISTTIVLFPPEIVVSSSQISIWNDSANYEPSEGLDQTFKGIEIFYRIFKDSTDANAATDTLNQKISYYPNDPHEFMNFATGEQQKFLRMRSSTNTISPLLTISATDTNQYTIKLSTWEMNDISNTKVIRNINRFNNTNFEDRYFLQTDEDYSGPNSIKEGDYFIVCFAVAYGEYIGEEFYSIPKSIEKFIYSGIL